MESSVQPIEKSSTDVALEPISINTIEKRRKSTSSSVSTQSLKKNDEQVSKPVRSDKAVKNVKTKKPASEDENTSESGSDESESDTEIENEEEILESLDLEYTKLQSNLAAPRKENVCALCEMSGLLIECQGTCQQSFHIDCAGLLTELDSANFKCSECASGQHSCLVCHKTDLNQEAVKKCASQRCGKYFHEECAKSRPLFRLENALSSRNFSYLCPSHTCVTCWNVGKVFQSEQQAACKGRLLKCVRCPNAYHAGDYCIPAGSIMLQGSSIVCAAHFKPIAKLNHHNRHNVTWCFACCQTNDLINCSSCPAAYHVGCVNNPPNLSEAELKEAAVMTDQPPSPASVHSNSTISNTGGTNVLNWRCEDCVNGRMPLYGDIVWGKVGIYRWWPAQICHPRNLPENLRVKPYPVGELPVRFFGTNDYYWVPHGRCFLFAQGDECQKNISANQRSLGLSYKNGVIDAIVAFKEVQRLKMLRYGKAASRDCTKNAKSNFQYIKTLRPVGNVFIPRVALGDLPRCDCEQKSLNPCGTEECMNKVLKYECVNWINYLIFLDFFLNFERWT